MGAGQAPGSDADRHNGGGFDSHEPGTR